MGVDFEALIAGRDTKLAAQRGTDLSRRVTRRSWASERAE
jgi:hypothetical protein